MNEVKLLKIGEMAKVLGMSKSFLYNAVSQKTIPVIHVGKSLRFDESKIIQCFESGQYRERRTELLKISGKNHEL
jgi:excisionase family DNA binding protein